MKTLGLRHVALNVKDPQRSKEFYIRVLKMQLEWEPDPENVYLTSGGEDNLAIHKYPDGSHGGSPGASQAASSLDHIGFALSSAADVDEWYAWMKSQQVKVVKEIRTHRDGARSFYVEDPDGIVIQMIYHAPIATRAKSAAR